MFAALAAIQWQFRQIAGLSDAGRPHSPFSGKGNRKTGCQQVLWVLTFLHSAGSPTLP